MTNGLYEDAVKFIRLRDYCVVSMLQRQFRIGYTHAMQLIAQLEKNGVLGPLSGGRRAVLNREEAQRTSRGQKSGHPAGTASQKISR